MSVSSIRRAVPSDRVVTGSVASGRVLFHLDDRRIRWLNDTAATVWDRMVGGDPIEVIASDLAACFDTDPATVRDDTSRLFRRLLVDGLIRTDAAGTGAPAADAAVRLVPDPSARSWPDEGCYRALDARVAVETADSEVGAVVAEMLEPLWAPESPSIAIRVEPGVSGTCRVTVSDRGSVAVSSRVSAVDRVLGEINVAAVESVSGHLVLHAGAVEVDDRVVLMPGRSNRGKSTLTASLVRAGMAYLTDEAAAVAPGRWCRTYAKPIGIDPGSFRVHADLQPPPRIGLGALVDEHAWSIRPDRIGSVSPGGQVTAIVFPEFVAGSRPCVTERSPSEAMGDLVGEAFDFAIGGQPVFDILCDLVDHVPVHHVRYGDLSDVTPMIGRLLGVG